MKGWDQSRCRRAAEMAITVVQGRSGRKDGEKKIVPGTLRKGNLQESDGPGEGSGDGWEGVSSETVVSQSVEQEPCRCRWLGVGHFCGLHVETWSKLWETWGLELRGDTHEGFVGSTTIKVWPWQSSLQRMQRGTLRMNSLNGKTAGKCSQRVTRGLPGWHCGHQGATAMPVSPQSAAPAVLPLLPLPLPPSSKLAAGPSPGSGNLLSLKKRDLPGARCLVLPCRHEEGKACVFSPEKGAQEGILEDRGGFYRWRQRTRGTEDLDLAEHPCLSSMPYVPGRGCCPCTGLRGMGTQAVLAPACISQGPALRSVSGLL